MSIDIQYKLGWRQCPECASEDLTWDYRVAESNWTGLRVEMFLGCDECSETVSVISLDEYIELTKKMVETNIRQRVKARHGL